jgi:ABC-type nickel/cobalt efflux system permease component RcnA
MGAVKKSLATWIRLLCVSLCVLCVFVVKVSLAHAHPVPQRKHDRDVVVHVKPTEVVVNYRLEVDDFTVVFVDLPGVIEDGELAKLNKPQDFYAAYARCYNPILADNLVAKLDGKELQFVPVKNKKPTHETLDSNSIRFDFEFHAAWEPTAGEEHRFKFQEANFNLEAGMLRLSVVAEPGITLTEKTEPDEALKKKAPADLRPGDDYRLRTTTATFRLGETPPTPPAEQPPPPAEAHEDWSSLKGLLALEPTTVLEWVVMLAVAVVLGSAHALTPGHGKTLVAAYLVGERGTLGHALILGLVTTVTHTGAVMVIAALLWWSFPKGAPPEVENVLGLAGGLLIAGLGFWILLRRLSGQADHVHIGGGHHHDHDEDAAVESGKPRGVSWRDLIVLGVSGGIVPCFDAIALLGLAIACNRLYLALPLLLAFSAGLAGVLIAIGVAVVAGKKAAQAGLGDTPGLTRAFRVLSIVGAVMVIGLGLWLCKQSLANGAPAPSPPSAESSP